jgi:two-component system sensor histidine kinase CreC
VISKRNRIFTAILVIYAVVIAFLLYRVLADLDPRYRESAEESLVETSQLMASLVEQDVKDGAIDTSRVAALFDAAQRRDFEAHIFSVTKQHVDLRLVVVDANARVLFDSSGKQTGADFSRWRDIVLALRGGYGARTTADEGQGREPAVMYVAAPVRWNGQIVGAVSVGKPAQSFGQFVQAARRKTLYVGAMSAGSGILLALLVSVWLARLGLVSDFWRFLRSQPRLSVSRSVAYARTMLRDAFDEMRDALAGRNYVADYVQTLTHELKSPLSAIRGAAELLHDPAMPPAERSRFLGHVTHEAQRIQQVVDRMMELTALEARRSLERVQDVALRKLAVRTVETMSAAARARNVQLAVAPGDEVVVQGDPLLLRLALTNLIDNAVDFSPAGGQVRVEIQRDHSMAQVRVIDQGPGIPDYARDKVFEKFYSLARPHTDKKSTGLGLSFVQRIAALHRGRVKLANGGSGGGSGGAVATLSLACRG